MTNVLDLEQALLLLELDPPFEQRDVQLARRRQAKVWHPDIAPPGKQFEHERHLKAINLAADQLERLAEGSRGGKVTRNAVKVSAAAAREARAEEGRRAYEAQQRARAHAADRERHDPFAGAVPDHSVVHRYARCLSYPEWGVGSVTGIYFTGGGDDIQQWARVTFGPGVRTVPAGSLQFVDFSTPDPGAERVQRFLTAAQHALAEGDAALAAQRLIYARDAEPDNVSVLRLMTLAFWQAGNLPAAGRCVRDWARVDGARPTPHRFASRIYEAMGATDLALEAAERAAARGPADAAAWERVGRLRLATGDRSGAIAALERARGLAPSVEGLLDLALAHQLAGDLGAEVTACEQATMLDDGDRTAWSRLAHALARTDRVSDAIAAAEEALRRGGDDEVSEPCRVSCRRRSRRRAQRPGARTSKPAAAAAADRSAS
jgi:tetratricopeptide (TPR) repeat protein